MALQAGGRHLQRICHDRQPRSFVEAPEILLQTSTGLEYKVLTGLVLRSGGFSRAASTTGGGGSGVWRVAVCHGGGRLHPPTLQRQVRADLHAQRYLQRSCPARRKVVTRWRRPRRCPHSPRKFNIALTSTGTLRLSEDA